MSIAVLPALALNLLTHAAGPCVDPPVGDIRRPTYEGALDYFPEGALNPTDCHWFSAQLESLEVAPLTSDGVIFRLRFLELPAFDYPMAITVSVEVEGVARIEARASNGAGGTEPGKLIYREQDLLTPRQTEFLIEEIARAALCEPQLAAKPANPVSTALRDETRNVFEWASGETYCLRQADARDDPQLSKLAIWLVQRVYAFDVTPPAQL